MARQLKQKQQQKKIASRFAGRIEQLEDRRVMAADMPLEHMASSDAPPLEQHVLAPPLEQHGIGDADFWIDPATQIGFDEYLQGVEKFLAQAHNLTGWFNVKSNYGFTGRGQTVAVIDSGIAYNHFALGGGFGSNYRVVGGWDFTEENDSNPYDDGPSGAHGTHVSGIIGSSDSSRMGVAPGVDLVGLRVFNDAGQGFFSWMENALRWIHTNRNAFANPITAVNMSVGVSSWNSSTIPYWTTLEDEFALLKADGIFISVSAGNSFTSFNAPGLSYPASSPNVVPVMSTDDAGNMSSFSQRLGRAIAAPGQNIVSTVPDYAGNNNGVADDFGSMGGTSMAAPYVAGASVLIRQAMQFVGMTNINQDTIYNHMMATADTFFDSVTNQNYKRLNLGRAIDTLMPADDFGSTTADAYNLGTLNSPAAMNGKIAKLTDVDCFRFTAASSGAVTFSATCSAGMTPTWQVWGATATPSATGTVSFNVVAGQTYTIGLSSPTCLGNYALASSMSTPFTFTDWGSVGFNLVNNVVASGEKWFRVTATRTGTLTALGAFNAGGGNVTVGFYNTSLQLLAAGATTGGQARADLNATAGTSYYVRVAGTNADVDFRLANLVTQTGSTVTVGGTAGNDQFVMAAGSFHWLSINDVSYGFALAGVNQISFDGGGGTDSFSFYGSAGAETVTLRSGSATITGASLNLSASNVENEYAHSGGGADVANLYDSAGNDGLVALPNKVTFTLSTGQVLEANGFARAKAWATTGTDTASFTDSAGVDVYIAGALRGILTGAGYWNEAEGFDQTIAYATIGGVDRVEYYDSAGNDAFIGWANRATITGAGFSHDARGFESTVAYAVVGGYDTAAFYDGVGNDAFTGWSTRATLAGTGYSIEGQYFDKVIAYATAGGVDSATFYDTAGNDNYIAGQLRGILWGAGFWNQADGFDSTVAYSSTGYDWVDYYDSAADDLYTAWWNRATFAGIGFSHDARGFEKTKAWSLLGGNDRAVLYDSVGNDTLHAGNLRAILLGANFWNEAEGFDRTDAHATAGGHDRVELYGTTGVDSLVGLAAAATYTGTGYRHDVDGFDAILGRGLLGNDSINVGATDWVFSQVGA